MATPIPTTVRPSSEAIAASIKHRRSTESRASALPQMPPVTHEPSSRLHAPPSIPTAQTTPCPLPSIPELLTLTNVAFDHDAAASAPALLGLYLCRRASNPFQVSNRAHSFGHPT
ncbi:hypothetical protein M0R45_013569 [Rubus argutus]|uniref:Uncharacterized protein n=1 Tax=Rubus argutus TaxID=59490 RepID=A0AAW1XIW2_RUBAR